MTDAPAVAVAFLDAEGTLYVPKPGRTAEAFWRGECTLERALAHFEPETGVFDALRRLRAQGSRVVVVSKHREDLLLQLFDAWGLRALIDDVILTHRKGQAIARFLETEGVPPSRALMLGDRPDLDVEPVLREGVPALLLRRDYNLTYEGDVLCCLADLPEETRRRPSPPCESPATTTPKPS
jgi:FMN phosphatase YigB (HAD superfamily)